MCIKAPLKVVIAAALSKWAGIAEKRRLYGVAFVPRVQKTVSYRGLRHRSPPLQSPPDFLSSREMRRDAYQALFAIVYQIRRQ